MSNKAAETVLNSHYMVNMPDGTQVLMQKLDNGKWVPTEDRVNEKEELFKEDDIFNDTETIPHDWNPQKSANITKKKVRSIEDLIKHSSTHAHLHAHLIEMLGSPEDIIKAGKLNETASKKTVVDYAFGRTVEQIIKALNCEPWNSVLDIMYKHRK